MDIFIFWFCLLRLYCIEFGCCYVLDSLCYQWFHLCGLSQVHSEGSFSRFYCCFNAVYLFFKSLWVQSLGLIVNYRTNFIKDMCCLNIQRYVFNQVLVLPGPPFSTTVTSYKNVLHLQRHNGEGNPQQRHLTALNGSYHFLPYW